MKLQNSRRCCCYLLAPNDHGVTLIEMMIYMVIAGMMLALAVTAFLGQNKSYNRQDVIAEIQQNIRGATEQMASDIRFAGIGHHGGDADADHAFFLAAEDYFAVNYWSDLNDYWRSEVLGDEKTVYYRLNPIDNNLERAYVGYNNDIPEGPSDLPDWNNLEWDKLAENIDVILFQYQTENDDDTWTWQNSVTDPDDFENIRAVKIMILGSSRDSAFNQTVDGTFAFPFEGISPPSGYEAPYSPPGSGYKRLVSKVVQTRNNRDN